MRIQWKGKKQRMTLTWQHFWSVWEAEYCSSHDIANWIKNIITPEDYFKLLIKKDLFTFWDSTTGEEKFDGPTMLKIILIKLDPSVLVGTGPQYHHLEEIRLHQHNNDVESVCTEIETFTRK